ncbi:hypothetical protein NFC81_02540 [Salinispirillum sp. LH 10-3-1]|uniref:DUF3575 domain-containing protein n=1 Tax=Salinispirillum sp. LH 10-3-1 TaxID=2952525 RepID=A0AB38YH76_9GAMM
MRPIFLVLCLSTCLAVPAAAVNVRTQPLYIFVGIADLALEVPVTQRITLMPNVRAQADLSEVQWGLQVNIYRQRRDENGWHAGLHAQTGALNSSSVESSYSVAMLSNYQWNWDEFNLTLSLGPQLKYEREASTQPDDTLDNWTLWPNARLSLGWQF